MANRAVIERSILINAAPEDIDFLLNAPEHAVEIWNSDEFNTSWDWPNVGSRAESISRMGPFAFQSTFDVLERQPGAYQCQQMSGSINAYVTWTLRPECCGTRLTITFAYDAPSTSTAAVTQMIDRMMLERQLQHASETVILQTKVLAESFAMPAMYQPLTA